MYTCVLNHTYVYVCVYLKSIIIYTVAYTTYHMYIRDKKYNHTYGKPLSLEHLFLTLSSFRRFGFCFPVDISLHNGQLGSMYCTVTRLSGSFAQLQKRVRWKTTFKWFFSSQYTYIYPIFCVKWLVLWNIFCFIFANNL